MKPQHSAIIMDGNRRWAKSNNYSILEAYEQGLETLNDTIKNLIKLKIKYLSTEILNTNFGKILCYKIQPYVQSGRVFKKDESLTMWITADKNRIPVKIKADIIVGSIRIDLESFSNLNNPFEIKFD